ncbi:2Fe-2S iron-sulfur cluster-binding protein [Candidatus Chlorohelix sp.]|uniref:2Fe-2S iron-sulfur cluster-binding protein n=1 Tax=Candidatus Chlorohelix sp. TaxID=3139201 RepID=UPI00303466D2
MPKVIINDEEFEGAEGDLLLDVARRNGAHIGFMCNGNGACSTCECRVISGAENLSPLSEAEKAWLTKGRLDMGMRLGCQVGFDNNNPDATVVVLTRVEELRRLFFKFLRGTPEGKIVPEGNLISFSVRVTLDHVVMGPTGLINSVNRLGIFKTLIPWGNEFNIWLNDGLKVYRRMTGRTTSKFEASDVIEVEEAEEIKKN